MEDSPFKGAANASASIETPAEAVEMKFELVPNLPDLPQDNRLSLQGTFTPFKERADTLIALAATVTDPELARNVRLRFRKLRGEVEATRKDLKSGILALGKAIDGTCQNFLAYVEGHEKAMDDIEKREEREAAARRETMVNERREKLRPYLDLSVPIPTNLGDLTEEQFEITLDNAKMLHTAKEDRKRKLAEEATEAERLAAIERERVAEENRQLQEEAKQRETAAALLKERSNAIAAFGKIPGDYDLENLTAEAFDTLVADLEKERDERLKAEEKERQEREAKRKKLAARIDQVVSLGGVPSEHNLEGMTDNKFAALVTKMEAEKKKRDEQAEQERRQREREQQEAAEAKKRAEAAEKEAQRLREEETQRQKDTAEAAVKAAQAPDKEKFGKLAALLRTLTPEVTSDGGKALAVKVTDQLEKFAVWIEKQSAPL